MPKKTEIVEDKKPSTKKPSTKKSTSTKQVSSSKQKQPEVKTFSTKKLKPNKSEDAKVETVQIEEQNANVDNNVTLDEALSVFANDIADTINRDQESEILNDFPMPNVVKPSVILIHEPDPFKKIEAAGRTCYKSEDAITKDSALRFVKGIMKSQHSAMIEHFVPVFAIDCDDNSEEELMDYIQFIQKTDFMFVTIEPDIPRILVSGNIRAILERKLNDPVYQCFVSTYPEFAFKGDIIESGYYHIHASLVDIRKLKDLTEDEFLTHFNLTIKFITDRGVSHEIVRHRRFSFAQESTRYCNYSKDKFGNHCTFCEPSTYDDWTEDQKDVFLSALSSIDQVYQYLISGENALSPQQARAILPNCLKTEIVVTGPAFEWMHFFNLRSKGNTGAPHPDMKLVADEARKKANKYISSLKYDNKFKF